MFQSNDENDRCYEEFVFFYKYILTLKIQNPYQAMRSMFVLKKKEMEIFYLYRSTAQTHLGLFSARLLYFQSYFLTYTSLYEITVLWYLIGFK